MDTETIRYFVLPYYEKNDTSHMIEHADEVCKLAIELSNHIGYSKIHLAVLAAYLHDTQVHLDRTNHHMNAKKFVLSKDCDDLFKLINAHDRMLVACAVGEHRASFTGKYTSILSEITSSADRGYPDSNLNAKINRSMLVRDQESGGDTKLAMEIAEKHIVEKYGRNGYAKYPSLYRKYFAKELEAMWKAIDELAKKYK